MNLITALLYIIIYLKKKKKQLYSSEVKSNWSIFQKSIIQKMINMWFIGFFFFLNEYFFRVYSMVNEKSYLKNTYVCIYFTNSVTICRNYWN